MAVLISGALKTARLYSDTKLQLQNSHLYHNKFFDTKGHDQMFCAICNTILDRAIQVSFLLEKNEISQQQKDGNKNLKK